MRIDAKRSCRSTGFQKPNLQARKVEEVVQKLENKQREEKAVADSRAEEKKRANCVEDDNEYAFSVYDKCVLSVDSGTVQLKVGGAIIKGVLIDSGASCNVVDKETWEDLKSFVRLILCDTFAYRSPHNKLRFNASRYHSFKNGE